MRALGLIPIIFAAGCASLLGIDDPRPRDEIDAAEPDAGEAPTDYLAFSLASLRIAQTQMVRVRVAHVLLDGSSQDVTDSASYSSEDLAVAGAEPGRIIAAARPGTTTITARLGGAAPATLGVTVTTFECHPVVNELTTGDTSGSSTAAADEWVEIYNPCANAIDVTGWTLVYRASSAVMGDDTNLMTALVGSIGAGEFRLYAGAGFIGASDATPWTGTSGTGIMQQTMGAVGLRAGPMNTGRLIDSVAYGGVSRDHPFIELTPTPPMAHGRSASRLPYDGKDDGDDTHDGDGASDFMIIMTPTPRAPNAP